MNKLHSRHPSEEVPAPRTFSVLRSALTATDYDGAARLVLDWAQRRDRSYAVGAANTHLVTLHRHDADFAASMSRFDLLLPDGMPLIWCLNRIHHAEMRDRVYGPTFMLRTLEASGDEVSHYLLGGSADLLARLQVKLSERFPKVRWAGNYAPPFGKWDDAENQRIIDQIAAARPGVVWVGLGCPKQEHWIARNKDRLPPAVYCGVGAAFAFHAGEVRQAPAWMQDRGLEWLFRLATEPRRLWRRYFLYNSLFLYYLAKDSLRR